MAKLSKGCLTGAVAIATALLLACHGAAGEVRTSGDIGPCQPATNQACPGATLDAAQYHTKYLCQKKCGYGWETVFWTYELNRAYEWLDNQPRGTARIIAQN